MELRRHITAALLAAFTLLSPARLAADETSDTEKRYMDNVQKAEEAIGKRNWPLAIAYLQEAMHGDPGNPQNIMLMSNMGMLQFYNGEDSLALRTLTEVRAMAPASVVILSNRAQVLTGMNRLDDALNDYNRIIGMDSTYADAWRERGSIMLRQGKLAEAENDVDRYRKLRPSDDQGKLMQAVIYAATGRPDEAIPLYGELIEKKAESVYLCARASCYLQKSDLLAAAEDIARGLELDPDDGELYYCRAWLNRLRFRDEDATADARRAVERGVNPLRVKALLQTQR